MDQLLHARNNFVRQSSVAKVQEVIKRPFRPAADIKNRRKSEPKTDDDPHEFYPGTTVPVTKLSIHKQPFFKPGPGRYNPSNNHRLCGANKSLNSTPNEQTKIEKTRPVMRDNKLNFDEEPRIPISFNPLAFVRRPTTIRFNTTDMARFRHKRKSRGRNVAFMCGTTRFENQPFQAKLNVRPAKPLEQGGKPTKKLPRKTVTKQLQYQLTPCVTARTREKIGFTYAALPEPKLIERKVKAGVAEGWKKEFFQTVNEESFYGGTSSSELVQTVTLNAECRSGNDDGVEKKSPSLEIGAEKIV